MTTVDLLGLTLAEYSAARGIHPQAVRDDYSAMMREARGLALPAITRQTVDDGVIKFCLPAGEYNGKPLETESVIIPMYGHHGNRWKTLCVSSQVGCRMGCTFCETGRMGLLRNLTAGEIVQQRLVARELLWKQHGPTSRHPVYHNDGIQNIVFMGMGEPLDNLDAVIQAIRVLSDPRGLDFPLTQITISTVGRIDGIRRLAALNWPNLRLAISLNAPTDDLRNQLMPINKGMPLAELQRALIEFPKNKKTRFLIEYVLIKDVNDSPAHANLVADWCAPLPVTVNVIPYNPQSSAPYETPSDATVTAFVFALKQRRVFAKRRVTHGRDAMGACGQLGNPEIRRGKAAGTVPLTVSTG